MNFPVNPFISNIQLKSKKKTHTNPTQKPTPANLQHVLPEVKLNNIDFISEPTNDLVKSRQIKRKAESEPMVFDTYMIQQ